MFTFGIGSGVSTELVNGIARAGNGKAEFVYEGERMQPKVHIGKQIYIPTYNSYTYKCVYIALKYCIVRNVCGYYIYSI